MDADGAWKKSNICTRIPGLVGPLLRAACLQYRDGMVSSEASFPRSALHAVHAFSWRLTAIRVLMLSPCSLLSRRFTTSEF